MRRIAVTIAGLVFSALVLAQGNPPNEPQDPRPPDGSINVSSGVNLCVTVVDPQGEDLNVDFYARDLTAQPGEDFAIIVIPDSQYYSENFPSIYYSQIEWIVANRKALNVAFVTHVGDIVHRAWGVHEWDNADLAMSLLDDPATTELPDGIPVGYSVGNHDQDRPNGPGTLDDPGLTTPLFNEHFGLWRYEGRSWYGGHMFDNNDNSYQLFEAGGMKFIIFHHEFDELDLVFTDQVLAWTEQVLDAHSDRRAIITSHHLICPSVSCEPTVWNPFSRQGQATYDALKHRPEFFLMIAGHSSGSWNQPRRTDVYDGNTVHTVLANYQRGEDCPYPCGNGYLRIMTFKPSQDLISATTYSPWLDQFKEGPCSDGTPDCHAYDLAYDMEGGIQFEQVGSLTGVPSGMSACAPWSGRQRNGDYEWYVEVSNSHGTIVSPRWVFTSNGSCNLDPQCDEGEYCTTDSCDEGLCVRDDIPDCCVVASDCGDDNYCTDETCLGNACDYVENVNPCSDGDACTLNDVCSTGVCVGSPNTCDDANVCTSDSCTDGSCVNAYVPTPGCCAQSLDCDDADLCTMDTCDRGANCTNAPIPECCNTDVDCPDDGDACTLDTCLRRNLGAAHFDGVKDHVSMHHAWDLGLMTFTLECWFNWDGGGSPAVTSGFVWDNNDIGGITAFPLVTKGITDQEFGQGTVIQDRQSVNYFLGIHEPNDEILVPILAADFEEHSSGSGTQAVNHRVLGVTEILPNTWYHAAATYDGRCWQLYLNGQPETDGTNCPYEPPAWESWAHFAVGTAQDWNGGVVAFHKLGNIEGRFSGLIDEVRVWDRALSMSEIQQNMSRPLEYHPDMLGRWGLDGLAPGSEFLTPDSMENLDGVVHYASFVTSGILDMGGGSCDAVPLVPTEAERLMLGKDPSTVLTWGQQLVAVNYDVIGGTLAELQSDAGIDQAECLSDAQSQTSFTDTRPDPAILDAYYYLVRAENSCGIGTYGFSSDGTERVPLSACP